MRLGSALFGAMVCVSSMVACSDDRDGALTYIDAAIDAEVDMATPDMIAPDGAAPDGGDARDGGDAGEET